MKSDKIYEITDYVQGWTLNEDIYYCLYCSSSFNKGQIYPEDERLITAKTAVQQHVKKAHSGALAALLHLPKEMTGLSDTQQEILKLFAQQLPDSVIAQRLGISTSTVRNHRFKLKEKERQAKVFVSIMQQLNEPEVILPHSSATMLDERYQITEAEQEKILATYFDEDQFIKQFPSKEKRKLVLLNVLAQKFDTKKNYSESAVNDILKQHIEDYVTVRRYLIEYGFLRRTKDGKTYWRAS